jgi:uncharacterized damage-inducible protein DinB
MADGDFQDLGKQVLSEFLEAQRASVLAIVDGMSEDALRAVVVPSGWTPLGLIEHLGHAERHWFQDVALGWATPLPWPDEADEDDEDDDAPFTTSRPADIVFAFYRDQIERSTAVLASVPLSAAPLGRHNREGADQVTDLRFIVLHMIEETARHAGHLDIARELIDGKTGLGPR